MERRSAGAYQDDCEQLWQKALSGQTPPSLLAGFWNRWRTSHKQVLDAFARNPSGTSPEWNQASSDLVKMRERLVSTFLQGASREADSWPWPQGPRAFLARLLQGHDALYVRLLEEMREELRQELARAQVMRRAIGAYANQVRQMGEG